MADSEAKEEGNSALFVALEEKLASLESENTDLIHQNEILSEQLIKKEKECLSKSEQYE